MAVEAERLHVARDQTHVDQHGLAAAAGRRPVQHHEADLARVGGVVRHVHVRLDRVLGRLVRGSANVAGEHGARGAAAAELAGHPAERRAEGAKILGRADGQAAQQHSAVQVEQPAAAEQLAHLARAGQHVRRPGEFGCEQDEREACARRRADRLGKQRRLARGQRGAPAHRHGPRVAIHGAHAARHGAHNGYFAHAPPSAHVSEEQTAHGCAARGDHGSVRPDMPPHQGRETILVRYQTRKIT
mmetsp:Transcript_17444/g.41452  ORF Transcript_17444/g.41452 Transcript_17444/m.41452 type:complete len:244 (+) Transcript_17444:745-1476(+)